MPSHSHDNKPTNAAEVIAGQTPKFVPYLQEHLAKLGGPNTGNAYLTAALKHHVPALLAEEGVIVPNDPEEMRWRLFFAHSQDMYGFRADIFTGGLNEADNPHDPTYKGLRDRWPDGKTMIAGLAALWSHPDGQQTLRNISNPFRSKEEKAKGIAPALALLRGPLGNEATRTFADAYERLRGPRIAHKTNAIVPAYCQNAALLTKHDCCFQTYLYTLAKPDLPSDDISDAETAWVKGIQQDFYNVGPALAPYLVADWLLGFWCGGSISWFSLYKADSVFLKAVSGDVPEEKRYLPMEAAASQEAFIAYCRTLRLPPEWIPADLWLTAFYNLPPRIVNEVIWLDNNQSTPSSPPPPALTPPSPPEVSPSAADNKLMTKLLSAAIVPMVRAILDAADAPLTSYEILERLPTALRDQLIAERGLPGAGSGNSFSAATLVTQAVEKVLPSKDAPYRVYQNMAGRTFTIAGQIIKPGYSTIATYQLDAASAEPPHAVNVTSGAVFELPLSDVDGTPPVQEVDKDEWAEDTLDPPGHTPDPYNPYLLVVNTAPSADDAGLNKEKYSFAPSLRQGAASIAGLPSPRAVQCVTLLVSAPISASVWNFPPCSVCGDSFAALALMTSPVFCSVPTPRKCGLCPTTRWSGHSDIRLTTGTHRSCIRERSCL